MKAVAQDVALDVTPLSATIGSCVSEVDLRRLQPDVVAAIRAVLVDRKVLFFPGQRLDPAELVALGRAFGEVTPAHPVMPGLADHPEVLEVDATRSRNDARYRDEYENDTWHADVTFMATPPLGSLLQAKVVPPAGGDTLFADLQAAYDTLSDPIRTLVDDLVAVHDGRAEFARFLASNPDGGMWDGERFTELTPVEHPVVRTHPESGRRGLFVNPTFTSHVVGLSGAESKAVLDLLYGHATSHEHLVRWRWSEGDIAFWDNRSTLHYPVRDYGAQHRLMHRVTIRGDRPY
ncbi:MAG: alkyl sulfatase [Actinomycetota bacterium]|jgi:taurine dioxygenase|nr:alkyl sulfatase [Actinomycetota bacterium]